MQFKKQRFGNLLLEKAAETKFLDQTHVIFGGTGAVGGATALQMIAIFEELVKINGSQTRSPRIIITGRSRHEVRQFTGLLFRIQQRDHNCKPERIEGVGYRTAGGILVDLTSLVVDPSIKKIRKLVERKEAGRETFQKFLKNENVELKADNAEKVRYLSEEIKKGIGTPFARFLMNYRKSGIVVSELTRFRSVIVGIPLASIAAYKLREIEEAATCLGLWRDSDEVAELKEVYLRAIRDDLSKVANELACEVIAAHTTAVGGMFDEADNGTRKIRLGFAHRALDAKLARKQIFAEKLTRLYAEVGIKMLITAASVGVDAILRGKSLRIKRENWRQLSEAADRGYNVIPEADLRNGVIRAYKPINLDLLAYEQEVPVLFAHGQPLIIDIMLRSGENGFLSVSNAEALFRVMRVTSSSEVGLLLARTAIFGDDPSRPSFTENVCYYIETDNSRQVFDLTGHPELRRNQVSGLQPKALQDLGSAKHQAELHILGLLIILHRLQTLDLDSIPPHVNLASFDAKEYFEKNSRILTLENVMDWHVEDLSANLQRLASAERIDDLGPIKSFFQADPDRQRAAHRVLEAAMYAAWAIPSLGTPIIYEEEGKRRVLSGCYAGPIGAIVTHRSQFAAYFRDRFEENEGGSKKSFENLVEFYIATNGFVDIRPIAVLVTNSSVTSRSSGNVQTFRKEAEFIRALRNIEPYSYFTTSGLIALLLRLKGILGLAQQLDLGLGSANEYRASIPHDERGRPLLVPGVIEAFRMISEGMEKNTGSERLDGRWGYYL